LFSRVAFPLSCARRKCPRARVSPHWLFLFASTVANFCDYF
jgi:hypothetical protein